MNTNALHTAIKKVLLKNASEAALLAHKKFVPGAELQNAYGVRMPVLNELAKNYKHGGFELAETLWRSGTLEEKILAAKLIGHIAKKDPQRAIQLVADCSKQIQDWAVCDTLGMQSLKPIVKTHQAEIFAMARKFNTSKNLWQRRLSLVLVEWYTRVPELHPQIEALIQPLEKDSEYYVKKAVVWIRKNFKKGK